MLLITANDDCDNAATSQTSVAKKKKTSIPRLLDGKYFEITLQNDTKIEAKCMTCGKVRKVDIRSTGNFMEHYSNFHPTLVNEVEQHKKGKKETILKQTTLFPTPNVLSTFQVFLLMNVQHTYCRLYQVFPKHFSY